MKPKMMKPKMTVYQMGMARCQDAYRSGSEEEAVCS
jgi:hypothetical protein